MAEGIFTSHIFNLGKLSRFDLVPFGDVHRDSSMCDSDRWKSFNARYKKAKNTFYIGMGDYCDFASGSERATIRGGKLHGQSLKKLDALAMQDIKSFVKEIEYMRGRIVGLLEGNHTWDFQDGKTATQVMCEMLGCKYLGDLSFIVLTANSHGGTRSKIELLVSHGKGGGKLLGSTFNRIEDMNKIVPQADIYLMGHDHKKGAISSTVIQFDGLNMKQKRQWYGRTGSFLKGYAVDEPSYVVDALYRPSDLGTIRFEVEFKRIRKNGVDVVTKDIHAWS